MSKLDCITTVRGIKKNQNIADKAKANARSFEKLDAVGTTIKDTPAKVLSNEAQNEVKKSNNGGHKKISGKNVTRVISGTYLIIITTSLILAYAGMIEELSVYKILGTKESHWRG